MRREVSPRKSSVEGKGLSLNEEAVGQEFMGREKEKEKENSR